MLNIAVKNLETRGLNKNKELKIILVILTFSVAIEGKLMLSIQRRINTRDLKLRFAFL